MTRRNAWTAIFILPLMTYLVVCVALVWAGGEPSGPTPIDVVSGSSGWAGAGLLGGVLFWLLRTHLPAKDAQLAEFINRKDEQVAALVKAHRESVERLSAKADQQFITQREDFRQMLQMSQDTCARELSTLTETLGATVVSKVESEISTLGGAVSTLNQAITALFQESARRQQERFEKESKA